MSLKPAYRIDEKSYPYISPSRRTLATLNAILDHYAIRWFSSCSQCRAHFLESYIAPTHFVKHVKKWRSGVSDI